MKIKKKLKTENKKKYARDYYMKNKHLKQKYCKNYYQENKFIIKKNTKLNKATLPKEFKLIKGDFILIFN